VKNRETYLPGRVKQASTALWEVRRMPT